MGKKRDTKGRSHVVRERRGGGAERHRYAAFRTIIIIGFGLALGLLAAVICCATLS